MQLAAANNQNLFIEISLFPPDIDPNDPGTRPD